jgi:baculoviral IAP repeat-containing protein 6
MLSHITNDLNADSAESICLDMFAQTPALEHVAMEQLLTDDPTGVLGAPSSSAFYGRLCQKSPRCVLMLWKFATKTILSPQEVVPFSTGNLATFFAMVADTLIGLHRDGTLPSACFDVEGGTIATTIGALVHRASDTDEMLASEVKKLICTLSDLADGAETALAQLLLAQADAAPDHLDDALQAVWLLAGHFVDARPTFAEKMVPFFERIAAFVARIVRDGLKENTVYGVRALEQGLRTLSCACRAHVGKAIVLDIMEQVVKCFAVVHIGSGDDESDAEKNKLNHCLQDAADAALSLVYSAWNGSLDHRTIVVNAVLEIVKDSKNLEYFVAQLVIDCRQFGDVVHVVVDDMHLKQSLSRLDADALCKEKVAIAATPAGSLASLIASMPTYSPTLSYCSSGAQYTVPANTTVAAIMQLHGSSVGTWHVHTNGEVREEVDDLLSTVASLSRSADGVRLSVSPRTNTGAAEDSIAIGQWRGEWKSTADVSAAWVYAIEINIKHQAASVVHGTSAVSGIGVFTLKSRPADQNKSKFQGAKRHQLSLEGTFDQLAQRLKLSDRAGIQLSVSVANERSVLLGSLTNAGALMGDRPTDSSLPAELSSDQLLVAAAQMPDQEWAGGSGSSNDASACAGVERTSTQTTQPATFTTEKPSSMLVDLASKGGLTDFISLVKTKLSDASKSLDLEREAAPPADHSKLEKRITMRRQLFTWLSAMEGSLELPGFVERFIADSKSAALLLFALGSGDESKFVAVDEIRTILQDPTGSQLTHNLTQLFSDGSGGSYDVSAAAQEGRDGGLATPASTRGSGTYRQVNDKGVAFRDEPNQTSVRGTEDTPMPGDELEASALVDGADGVKYLQWKSNGKYSCFHHPTKGTSVPFFELVRLTPNLTDGASFEPSLGAAPINSAWISQPEQVVAPDQDTVKMKEAAELRSKCLEKGTLDIVLLHLGKLHEMSPVNPDWTDQFDDPAIVRERKAKEKAHAEAERAKQLAKPKKDQGGNDDFVIPSQGFGGGGGGGGGGSGSYSGPATPHTATIKTSNGLSKEAVDKSTMGTFECLTAFLDVPAVIVAAINMQHVRRALESSPLVKVVQSVMMATETDDVQKRPARYATIVRLLATMCKHEAVIGLVDVGAGPTSPYEQLKKLGFKVDALVTLEDADTGKDSAIKAKSKAKNKKVLLDIKGMIAESTDAVEAWRIATAGTDDGNGSNGADNRGGGIETVYGQRMAKHHFAYRNIVNDSSHVFKYKKELNAKDAKPERQAALLRELTGNLLELPIHFNTSTLIRVDESQQFAMQFLVLAGQEGGGSPYDGGAFLFDLFVPGTYPRSPPKTTLATTGGGTVRFNPNLYLDGYVCLTVLNAKGSGGESWRPNNSNLFEVIMAIQSFVLNKMYPLFNEPSEQSRFKGADTDAETKRRARTAHWKGVQFGETGYQAVREGTLEHAMIAQLKHPPAGFEDAIREHFLLKGPYIVRQVEGWIDDASRFDDATKHMKKLETLLVEFKSELTKLSEDGKYMDGTKVGPVPAVAEEEVYKYQQYPF